MTFSVAFLLVVLVIVVVPGADFAVIVRNTITRGRGFGVATALGVSAASATQGLLVSVGLAKVLVGAHPVFMAVKWLGVAYLAYLAVQSIRSAIRGTYDTGTAPRPGSSVGFRQGLLCNATNPKVLVFYLALLPQFVPPAAPWWAWLAHAWMIPALGTLWSLGMIAGIGTARHWLSRRGVRRALDTVTGVVLFGFCGKLAASQ